MEDFNLVFVFLGIWGKHIEDFDRLFVFFGIGVLLVVLASFFLGVLFGRNMRDPSQNRDAERTPRRSKR